MAKKLLINSLLIDGNGGSPIEGSGILIEGETITAVGNAGDFSLSESETEVIDCRGKTIMPGMINGHVHVFMEPYTWDRIAYQQEPLSGLCVKIIDNLKKLLHSGVTYVRDLGGYMDLDIQFRDYIEEGKVAGPQMVCAHHPLTISCGHGRDFSIACDGPHEFMKGVRGQIRDGADVIKIMATAGYGRPKMKVNHSIVSDTIYMLPEEIRAVTDEAHKMGKMVAAHCCGFAGVYNSVMNGVDTIEHGQFRDTADAGVMPLVEEMAKRGTWLVPTLAAYYKEYERAQVERQYQSVAETFRICHENGVKIAMGTDAGVPWVGHDRTADELEHMSLYGMTNMETIVASTKNPAIMMGIIDTVGTLEKGKQADLLVLDGNPLEDITVLKRGVTSVYKKGDKVR